MLYIHVTDGSIDRDPQPLPPGWKLPDGSGVSGIRHLTPEELNGIGWYPCVEMKPAFDPLTHEVEYVGTVFEPANNRGVSTWRVVPLSQAELDDIEDQKDVDEIRQDNAVKTLILARPHGIDTYIDNNVTDLASAKEVLKILAKAISAIGKRQFR